MLHELLIALSGFTGDIFRPFPPEPAAATTFAITDFPLLHPAEKEVLNRLAQLGFYFRQFGSFISNCRSPFPTQDVTSTHHRHVSQSLYRRALANALERKLQCYQQVIIQTESAILSGKDNLGGIIPLSTIATRFAPFQLVFSAMSSLIDDIETASATETPYAGGRLIDLLQEKAASGVPILQEWMRELLQSCLAVMMRQIVSWVIYGQIQDPFDEFFVLQVQRAPEATDTPFNSGQPSGRTVRFRAGTSLKPLSQSSSAIATSSFDSAAAPIRWQAEYALDVSMIPAVVPAALAHAILFVGKSIATARQAKPRPIPIPTSMTHRHLSLILPIVSSTQHSSSTVEHSFSPAVINQSQLTSVIHQIRRDVASYLWVEGQVGVKVVMTLESFRRYFLLRDGEFGLGLIQALEEFKRNRLSRLGHFMSHTTPTVSIRDHDLGGILIKAAQGTPAHEDPALRSFELQLLKPTSAPQGGAAISSMQDGDPTASGMFDDQLLGIPVRLSYTLSWPLDFFLTSDDLKHYGDVFAFLLTVRKAQVKLQQIWVDIKSMTQQMTIRKRGRGVKAYNHRIKGLDGNNESYEQESQILRHVAAMRSDMVFVADCLWTYLQMDVIGPTYDSLLNSIITQETEQGYTSSSSVHNHSSATAQSFDFIHSYHEEALHEIRRACLLTSETLSLTIKDVLLGTESFCGIVGRRAAGQNGFQAGLGDERDESMWQDWTGLCRLHQVFRRNMAKLFVELSAVSRSGSLDNGTALRRSISGRGLSLLGNSSKSFDVVRQLDQLLLRLEYSKRMWFSTNGSNDGHDEVGSTVDSHEQ